MNASLVERQMLGGCHTPPPRTSMRQTPVGPKQDATSGQQYHPNIRWLESGHAHLLGSWEHDRRLSNRKLAGVFETGRLSEEADDSSIGGENAIDSDSDWEDDDYSSEPPHRRLSDADPGIFQRRPINQLERLSLITLGLENKGLYQEITVRKKVLLVKKEATARQNIIQKELAGSLRDDMRWEREQTSADSNIRRRRHACFRRSDNELKSRIFSRYPGNAFAGRRNTE